MTVWFETRDRWGRLVRKEAELRMVQNAVQVRLTPFVLPPDPQHLQSIQFEEYRFRRDQNLPARPDLVSISFFVQDRRNLRLGLQEAGEIWFSDKAHPNRKRKGVFLLLLSANHGRYNVETGMIWDVEQRSVARVTCPLWVQSRRPQNPIQLVLDPFSGTAKMKEYTVPLDPHVVWMGYGEEENGAVGKAMAPGVEPMGFEYIPNYTLIYGGLEPKRTGTEPMAKGQAYLVPEASLPALDAAHPGQKRIVVPMDEDLIHAYVPASS